MTRLAQLVCWHCRSISQAGTREDDLSYRHSRLEPTPTPISRSDSPAKSVKSIHWILGHNRYHTFDKKVGA